MLRTARMECINAQKGEPCHAGVLIPPIVHEHVERVARFDVVPPHVRNEQRITRLELGVLRRRDSAAAKRGDTGRDPGPPSFTMLIGGPASVNSSGPMYMFSS